MISIGLLGAFLAGIFSLISPCSALLLPAFFAYAFSSTRQLLFRTLVFFLGLCVTLVPVGMGVAALALHYRDTVIVLAGWVLIALAIYAFCGGGFSIPGLNRLSARARYPRGLCARRGLWLRGILCGTASRCGPDHRRGGGSGLYGALIMVAYAAGMAAPLFLLAATWDHCDIGGRSWLRGRTVSLGPLRTNTLSMLSGLLLAAVGLVFLTSHGTATLPALFSTDAQYRIQLWAQNFSTTVSDAWVGFGLCALVAAAAGWKAARTTSR
ncbi:cytochrome c biogenesis CcdA family protein [Corynebacterium flavescens]|uniref:cytochrome c biogenesis CcdA family protein n=1 Tax=Corynebacterium flavescens TaxID=28028 RepID=UPI003FD56541